MKKLFLTLTLLTLATIAGAQTPTQMLDRAIAALRAAGTISADYRVTSAQGNNAGAIVMSGAKYRLTSTDIKCWFDGKTQWTWSRATDEVNITTPTADDLQMTNPMAAVTDFRSNYNVWKAKGQVAGCYALLLMPRKKCNIDRVYLYLTNGTYLLNKAHIKMTDGSTLTLTLSNYKTKLNVPASTFTFDSSSVPKGTAVVDLR